MSPESLVRVVTKARASTGIAHALTLVVGVTFNLLLLSLVGHVEGPRGAARWALLTTVFSYAAVFESALTIVMLRRFASDRVRLRLFPSGKTARLLALGLLFLPLVTTSGHPTVFTAVCLLAGAVIGLETADAVGACLGASRYWFYLGVLLVACAGGLSLALFLVPELGMRGAGASLLIQVVVARSVLSLSQVSFASSAMSLRDVRAALHLAGADAMSVTRVAVELVIIRALVGEAATATYRVAWAFVQQATAVVNRTYDARLPALMRQADRSVARIPALRFLVLSAGGLGILAGLGSDLVVLLLGFEVTDARRCVVLICLGALALTYAHPLELSLLAVGREAWLFMVSLRHAALSAALLPVLVWRLELVGAPLSFAITALVFRIPSTLRQAKAHAVALSTSVSVLAFALAAGTFCALFAASWFVATQWVGQA